MDSWPTTIEVSTAERTIDAGQPACRILMNRLSRDPPFIFSVCTAAYGHGTKSLALLTIDGGFAVGSN